MIQLQLIQQATCLVLYIYIALDQFLTVECVYFSSSKELPLFRKNHGILLNYNHSTKGYLNYPGN
jgi:hypothetical protein